MHVNERNISVVKKGVVISVENDCIGYIYSLTKAYIATLVVQLAEQKSLSLDDSIRRFLDDKRLSETVTIRQLLNHTSGLPDYGELPEYHEAVKSHPLEPWTAEQFISFTLGKSRASERGSFRYSNLGYMLLRLTLEKVTGRSFSENVEGIGKALGLHETYVVARPSGLQANYHPAWVAHGLIAASSSNVGLFFDALLGDRIVSANSLAEMQRGVRVPVVRQDIANPEYGLGLMMMDTVFGKIVGHEGGGPGYSVICYHVQKMGATVAMSFREEGIDTRAMLFKRLERGL